MDDVNNNDMNPPGEDVIRSPPLTEDDLIDSLFLACDVRSDGTVPVSSLIEYLKLTSSAISENDEDLQSLERLFNEDGEKINIKVYRTKMKQWIYSIRKRNELESDQEDGLEQSEDSSCLSKDLSLLNGSSMDSSVVGTFGTEFDPVDQQNTIADLQYQNRKLSDENTKLRQQLDVQEDIVNINNTEIEKLQKKIKNLQQVVDSRHDIIEENEELKVTVTKLQEKKTELSSKVTHLEKERGNFENECCDLKAKLNDIATQLESVTALKVTLNKELAECRHELAHAKELKGIQEVHLNERYLEVSSLKKQLQDMSTELKECIKEKEEVKVELLQSLHVSRQVPSESGAADDILPTAVGSFVCSTPMRPNQSLCMELKGLIGHEKCMPSPLCPKEYHKEYRLEPMPVFTEEDEDGNDDATNNQLTQDISRFTEKFRHKQSELLAEIDSYFRQEECGETSQSSLQEKLQSSLSRELAEMTEQMASLAIAKDNADKRISQLSESMKKKKGTFAQLRSLFKRP